MKRKSVGFPISTKENERRRALLPIDLSSIKNPASIFIEAGYGQVLGYEDKDYVERGANIASKEEILTKEIICDPKIGDANYLNKLQEDQIIFGWIHAIQNRNITDLLVNNKITAYAWEDMFEDGKHTLYRNNEIAGEAAIIHAFLLYGLMPYETEVAVIGRGNIALGALNILNRLGAKTEVYNRNTEKLFMKKIEKYDVVVNALLWDTSRKDHIINRTDLKRMKKGAMIIDISCDRNGAVESCTPTSINEPVYYENGILHYAVDHTPALFFKTISKELSKIVSTYIDDIIENRDNLVLKNALIIEKGNIIDERIKKFQNR